MAHGSRSGKRAASVIGAVAFAAALAAGAFAAAETQTAKLGIADGEYTLVLDSSNAFSEYSSGSGSVTTTSGTEITFGYVSGSAMDGGFMTIASDGSLYNSTAISGISSIISGADQDLTLTYWWSDEAEALTADLPAGGSFTFSNSKPSYFRVKASADTNIESLTIKYTCAAESTPSDLDDTEATEGLTIEYDSESGTYVVKSGKLGTASYTGTDTTVHIPAYYDDGTNGKRPVTSMGEYAFYDCDSITEVEIPSTVTEIGTGTFQSCGALTTVEIPSSVTTIGEAAFESCTSLASIEIPDSVTTIGKHAFSNCSSLTSITIPASVTSIGENAFFFCSSLSYIEVDASNENYSNSDDNRLLLSKDGTEVVQAAMSGLTTYSIPSTVTTIGYGAFEYCTTLASVEIPGSVTVIEENAFHLCIALTSIVIPGSVTTIGKDAFYLCTAATSITFQSPSSLTTIGTSAFGSCSKVETVTYEGSVDDWENNVTQGDSAFAGVQATSVTCNDGEGALVTGSSSSSSSSPASSSAS
jgi:hypothetical protein